MAFRVSDLAVALACPDPTKAQCPQPSKPQCPDPTKQTGRTPALASALPALRQQLRQTLAGVEARP